MPRPSKTAPIDLRRPQELSGGLLDRLTCPPERDQAFVRDVAGNGLLVRVTRAGAKSFIFERKLGEMNIRKTIGSITAWSIPAARAEARRMAILIDQGIDPREQERQQAEAKAAAARAAANDAEAARIKAATDALTVAEAWSIYIKERTPFWSPRTLADHHRMTQPGGRKRLRGEGVTVAGPLAPLMSMRLVDLDGPTVEAWAAKEAQTRAARTRLALRLLKAFLRWCSEHPELKDRADKDAASTKRARESAGRPKLRHDVLEKSQLATWFAHVRQLPPVTSAYLQTMVLTGGRPGEVLALKWADLDFTWNSITMRDKDESKGGLDGERTIPLPPYIRSLLERLPKTNEWVFSSTLALTTDDKNKRRRERRNGAPAAAITTLSATGRLHDPGTPHRRMCAAAGLEGLTLHGLRRSFASLTEWLEVPAGVVAQIQGHKPSATREKHYIRRPLDLLRVHHERIERWMLEQAGMQAEAAKPLLAAVHN